MADELTKYAEVRVIGPAGAASLKPASVSISEAPLKPLPLFLVVATLKALWMALRWRPNIILAGSGLTAPIAWFASKLCGAKSAAYLHGFDITANSRVYRMFWRPFFKRLDRVITNSSPTSQLALDADVNPERLAIVYPGVSLPIAPQPAERIAAFRQQHGLAGKKILLSVGRLTTRKGLREFVELALPAIVKAQPDAVLAVIGETPKNSLGADIQTVESIQARANELDVSNHLKFLGVITDKVLLATAYESADVHVFPVRHIPDDPEGFGMVAIEAAAHGLPTVAFATGGVVDAVTEGRSGHLVSLGDYAEFAYAVISQIEKEGGMREACREYARVFEWSRFGEKLRVQFRFDG